MLMFSKRKVSKFLKLLPLSSRRDGDRDNDAEGSGQQGKLCQPKLEVPRIITEQKS